MSASKAWLVLLVYSMLCGFYIRTEFVRYMNKARSEGCEEAALKSEQETGDQSLHGFCHIRDHQIRRFLSK